MVSKKGIHVFLLKGSLCKEEYPRQGKARPTHIVDVGEGEGGKWNIFGHGDEKRWLLTANWKSRTHRLGWVRASYFDLVVEGRLVVNN